MAEYDEESMWDEYPPEYDNEQEEGAEEEDEEHEPEHSPEAEQEAQSECLKAFSTPDYIMEPEVFTQLKRYFKAGGAPEHVVQLLSDNYTAVAQTANLLAEWLIQAGVNLTEVQEIVENHLKEMIHKYFDPKKADSIFTDEGETPAWLAEMIEYPRWRNLFYQLAEEYPDCLMLNFTIKLISDAGYQGEITSVSTACHQIEVFSRVLRTSITSFLDGGDEALAKNLQEFTKMVCHGEHTYLYSQMLLHVLSQESKGNCSLRRLSQELHRCAQEKGLDVTPITLALSGGAAYPRSCQALSSMLSRGALNPADMTILQKMYASPTNPPPVEMIRSPQFLDLLVDALFRPGVKINPEHRPKYIYILAYISSVVETWKKGTRKSLNRDDLKPCVNALEKAQSLCSENKGSTELVADVGTLFLCLKFPVVAMCLMRWIDYTVSEASYFKLNVDHTPIHLILLDEISTHHTLMHQKILDLLIRLFETSYEDMDVMVQLELRKTLLDRMVHLLSHGCVLPVVKYIKSCWERGDTDISLIRHFVTEVLDMISPPYTAEFVQQFLPLIDSDDITGSLRSEDASDQVSEFLGYCRTNFS